LRREVKMISMQERKKWQRTNDKSWNKSDQHTAYKERKKSKSRRKK